MDLHGGMAYIEKNLFTCHDWRFTSDDSYSCLYGTQPRRCESFPYNHVGCPAININIHFLTAVPELRLDLAAIYSPEGVILALLQIHGGIPVRELHAYGSFMNLNHANTMDLQLQMRLAGEKNSLISLSYILDGRYIGLLHISNRTVNKAIIVYKQTADTQEEALAAVINSRSTKCSTCSGLLLQTMTVCRLWGSLGGIRNKVIVG